ncbi:MAG: hypothetical protein MK110_04275 [Fuerstiella sp.]|nr:hypothetical protein [Fuerstiella sp.]
MRHIGCYDRRLGWSFLIFLSLVAADWLPLSSTAGAARIPEAELSVQEADGSRDLADDESTSEVPFRLCSYRVRISVSMTGAVGGRSFRPRRLLDDIRQAVSRMYGRMWQLDVYAADWLRPGTPIQIAELDVADLIDAERLLQPSGEREVEDGELALNRYPESESDKAMLLGVAASTAGFEVICREYDTRTHDLSPAIRQFTPDRKFVAAIAARLVRDSFRPCLKYVRRYRDNQNHEFMQLQLQAAEIVPPDPSALQIRAGDVLRPFKRFMNRKDSTQLRRLRPLPLTYIRVKFVDQEVTRGLVTGVLLTHTPVSPFGVRGRGLEQIALRQRPVVPSSTVRLVERSVDNKPLVCQRLSVVYKLRREDQDELAQLKLISDRNGEVQIAVHEGFSTVWLYVYSGRTLLALIPYAPGLQTSDTIELPDDSIRLSVEGDLQLFQDELVDSIALREVQFSLARRAAKERRSEDLQKYLDEYAAHKTFEEFAKSLNLIRVSAENRAKRQQNRTEQRAILKMCNRMQNTLEHYFNAERLTRRKSELNDLRARIKLQPKAKSTGAR